MAGFHLVARAYLLVSRFRRGMTLGVRAAVIDGEGRFFLVRHSYTPGWYLPGGGVEPGETMQAALERELREEGGIVLGGPAVLAGIYLNARISRRDHVALFVCRDWTRPHPPRVPNLEIVDCGFFAPGDLPEATTDGTRRRIAEIVGGQVPSHEW